MSRPFYRKILDQLMELPIRVAPNAVAYCNNVRLGFPSQVYHGSGGIGDDLLCSCVFREIKKRRNEKIVFRTFYQSLFEGNPDVDILIRKKLPLFANLAIHGLNFLQLNYQVPMPEHFLVTLCRKGGVAGEIALRPYLYLTPAEVAQGRIADRQIVIQSAGPGSTKPMQNKEWYPERFQQVVSELQGKATFIQLGTPLDPLLNGAIDLRGKTTLREAAGILANSTLFVGQVGFLMHLARAVDCRSVIVYGGRETPDKTGYIANKNIVGKTPCSPCWEENKCDYGRACMDMISAKMVIEGGREQMELFGKPLETELFDLKP